MRWLASIVFAATALAAAPYQQYILAPPSRAVIPRTVRRVNGTVLNASFLTEGKSGAAVFRGPSTVTYDFGKNIAGTVSLTARHSSSKDASIWLTYSESSLWINGNASDATADAGLDRPLQLKVGAGPGTSSVDRDHERGGFRYLSLISNTSDTIFIDKLWVNFTAAPTQDLQAYSGYFHSNDELLNRIWYAGAYTNQLCTIDPQHGNALVHLGVVTSSQNISLPETEDWYYNTTITNGSSATVDGAKRDKIVWPGDLAISFPAIVVSTNDLVTVKNSLESLLCLQNPDGRFPYAGIPFADANITSFTYHDFNLIAIYNYYKHTGDSAWLSAHWAQYKAGVAWSVRSIDSTGLQNVTADADWLRAGMGAHNIEANAVLYYTLKQGIELATYFKEAGIVSNWTAYASGIKIGANKLLWDASAGLYKDNETTTLHPQDGNAWSIVSNLTDSANKTATISSALKARWGTYGAPAPEAGSPLTISPFVDSVELEAHYLASNSQNALDLMRLEWGFMLDDPRMTNSTFIEGYSADGSLHYAPYTNDPRVSHAHGWSTGPTSLLTFYTAGIRLTCTLGRTWAIEPQLNDLKNVDAGFSTLLGAFSAKSTAANGTITSLTFTTPANSTGDVALPGVQGLLVASGKQSVKLVNGKAQNVTGGCWALQLA